MRLNSDVNGAERLRFSHFYLELLSFIRRFCRFYQKTSSPLKNLRENLQIQHDNLVQEAREAQVAQLVRWVQADQRVQALLKVQVNQVLLELPVGW